MGKLRLKRKARISITLFFLLLLIIVITVSFNKGSIYNFDVLNKTIGKKEVWPKVKKISLLATGDVLLHNGVYMDGYDSKTDTFNFDKQLVKVKDIVSKYDIAYYNQETVFGGRLPDVFTNTSYNVKGYSSYPVFNSPSEYGDAMVKIGFNTISLASNHSADCKYNSDICIPNSYKYWESKNVVFDGFNDNEEQINKYNIKEINGIKYGFLNYTNTLNGLDGTITPIKYMVDVYDETKVDKEIKELKEKVDVVIVAMHWHYASAEYETTPTASNKAIANHLSDLGVDIILGTYSHCLQPFDIINGKTIVFYSLGNFISNQGDLVNEIGYKGIVGVLATMDIIKTINEDGSSSISFDNLGADLTYTYNNNHKNYLVIPFSEMDETYNKNYKSIYEDYKKILTSLNSNITIKPVKQ